MEDNALFFRACEMASATGEGARANRGRAAHAPRKTNMMKSKEEQAELHKAIWSIADSLRGSVSGWEFKAYVLGALFYRFISEKLENSVNEGKACSGNKGFSYGDLADGKAQAAKTQIVQRLGFFISPSHLFRNVQKNAAADKNLNVTLDAVFREIEDSSKGRLSGEFAIKQSRFMHWNHVNCLHGFGNDVFVIRDYHATKKSQKHYSSRPAKVLCCSVPHLRRLYGHRWGEIRNPL